MLVFDTIVTNEGGAYNPITGLFRAPRPGLYFFIWSAKIRPGTQTFTELSVNSHPVASATTDGTGLHSSYQTATAHAIVRLKSGDNVWVDAFVGHLLLATQTMFTGMFLAA